MDRVEEGRVVLGDGRTICFSYAMIVPRFIGQEVIRSAGRMAHVAARNIAAQIRGEQAGSHEAFGDMPAACVMDAGNNGVIILAGTMLPLRKHGVLIPGPQAYAMKLGFGKYFLWEARHGYVQLP